MENTINNKLNIIIIEDSKIHTEAAKEQLQNHNLVIFEKYSDFEHFIQKELCDLCKEAGLPEFQNMDLVHPMSFARVAGLCTYGLKNKIDMILTDNEIPVQPRQLGDNELPEKIGSFIVLLGLMLKIPMIGLLTDKNHHHDAHSAIFDCLGGSSGVVIHIGESKVMISSIHTMQVSEEKNSPIVKNWKALFDCLTA